MALRDGALPRSYDSGKCGHGSKPMGDGCGTGHNARWSWVQLIAYSWLEHRTHTTGNLHEDSSSSNNITLHPYKLSCNAWIRLSRLIAAVHTKTKLVTNCRLWLGNLNTCMQTCFSTWLSMHVSQPEVHHNLQQKPEGSTSVNQAARAQL